ncbi:PP2C family protein-serine/threonine phosphatase [Synechococcus sp. PCC 7336]|uniref:PP2C family protein-serine/threonine phosphatase n=1 Tax=Synechococcus sp. PCC 7336 TaxID=195250 RepID=UPI00034CBAEC|nr:GAF domain-containing SpoIIE family protein phosphatase [Synechococcus sp. PCC 7336]
MSPSDRHRSRQPFSPEPEDVPETEECLAGQTVEDEQQLETPSHPFPLLDSPPVQAIAEIAPAHPESPDALRASNEALQELVVQLTRERIKAQELMSSLGFALRSFTNLNQILELIPLVASRLTEADGAALVLFEPDGSMRISRMYLNDASDCPQVRSALERAGQALAELYAATTNELPASAAETHDGEDAGGEPPPATTDLAPKMASGKQLDAQLARQLGENLQMFGTPLLSRQVVRGRLYVFSGQPNYVWDANRQTAIRLVADQTAVAIENDYLHAELRQRAKLAREVEIGSEIQTRLQPTRCPEIEGIALAARCETASPVGGDYYDFIPVPFPSKDSSIPPSERPTQYWGIAIGDVMGKGVPAGLLMMATRGVLRAEVLHDREPAQILQHLNHVTFSDLENSNRFVSLFYSEYCPASRQLHFSNAAHNPSMWWHAATGEVTPLDTEGMLIGVELGSHYTQRMVQLEPEDVVVYYTDGVTEAVNPQGDRFEESGLIEAIQMAARRYPQPEDILESLFQQVRDFRQGTVETKFVDDMTLVILKVLPQED